MSTAFRVILEGTQEVPPNTSTASGLGTVIFDSTAITASYSFRIEGVDYGLFATSSPQTPQTPSTDDDVVSTHFHNQVRGMNGPVVFGQINPFGDNDDLSIVLNADQSWTVSGLWEATDTRPITDPAFVPVGATFDSILGSATVGTEVPLYFNVHTTPPFQAGLIRGQLVAIADDHDHVVKGTAGHDLLPGLGGDDVLLGFAGDDTVQGGDGRDVLLGGRGDDTLEGDAGMDFLHGGHGDDVLRGGADADFSTAGRDRTPMPSRVPTRAATRSWGSVQERI